MKNKNRSCLGTLAATAGAAVSLLWILNLKMGMIFEIPDNIPLIGNLDEAFFTALFIACLSYLGIELPFIARRGSAGTMHKADKTGNGKNMHEQNLR